MSERSRPASARSSRDQAICGEASGEFGAADLLFALHQHGHADRQAARLGDIGAERFHPDAWSGPLSSTMFPRDDPFSTRALRQRWLERRARPERSSGLYRLHVIVSIEQQMRGAAIRAWMVREHHGMVAVVARTEALKPSPASSSRSQPAQAWRQSFAVRGIRADARMCAGQANRRSRAERRGRGRSGLQQCVEKCRSFAFFPCRP